MSSARTCLQHETIVSLIDDRLSAGELLAVEEHLAECSECRARVEDAIGADQWWSDVRQSLLGTNESPEEDVDADRSVSTKQLTDLLGPTDDPLMLGRIGAYEVSGVLGQGGMGAVFKAFDRSLNRHVAIKMLLPHLAASAAARKRFAREAQASAAVVDDHVMAVHHVDEWQNVPYLVMPYTKGVSLQKRLAEEGVLDLREILRISLQAARGLAAAHAQGLVHRDVKPANIFLSENVERVQLVDFGLARAADDASLTRTGIVAGTPQYMSPEQARAETVSFRSDLFSLGSVMYTMCTGRPPFRAESSHAVLRLITDKTPRSIREINPDVPIWLCTIIERLMAKDPADRFESAVEVAELLEGCLAHVQQPEAVSLPDELQPRTTVGSRTRTLMLCAAAAILLFGGLFLTAAKPDISGEWYGDEWGHVKIKPVDDGAYEGTYTDTFGDGPGKIQLTWSRIERRYKGTWGQGKERSGRISVRLVDDEIRGAWTTSRKSDINPGVPSLADLTWCRAESFAGTGATATGTLMPIWRQDGGAASGAEIATAKRLAELIKSDSVLVRLRESISYRGSIESIRSRISIDATEVALHISFRGPEGKRPEDTTTVVKQIMRCFIAFVEDEQQICVDEVRKSLQEKFHELRPQIDVKRARDSAARGREDVDREYETDDEAINSWPPRDDPDMLNYRLQQLDDELARIPVLKVVVTRPPSVLDGKGFSETPKKGPKADI